MVSAWVVDTFTPLHTLTHTHTPSIFSFFFSLFHLPGYLFFLLLLFLPLHHPSPLFTSNTNVSFKFLFLSVCQLWHHRKLHSELAALFFFFFFFFVFSFVFNFIPLPKQMLLSCGLSCPRHPPPPPTSATSASMSFFSFCWYVCSGSHHSTYTHMHTHIFDFIACLSPFFTCMQVQHDANHT